MSTLEARRELVANLIEDVEFLVTVGEHPARIAHRLGRTPSGIHQTLRRAGRCDLATYFKTEKERGRGR